MEKLDYILIWKHPTRMISVKLGLFIHLWLSCFLKKKKNNRVNMNDDLYVINLLFFQLKPLTNTKCYWSPYPDLTISRWSQCCWDNSAGNHFTIFDGCHVITKKNNYIMPLCRHSVSRITFVYQEWIVLQKIDNNFLSSCWMLLNIY